LSAGNVSSYAFVGRPLMSQSSSASAVLSTRPSNGSSSCLAMVDGNVAAAIGIGVAGFAAGIGMVAFAEAQVRYGESRIAHCTETKKCFGCVPRTRF
jgi:hypothetical protein